MKTFTKLFSKIIISLLGLYSILGFIVIPYFIQFYVPSIIQKTIHTNSYIDSVHLNPFTFNIKISNLIINDQNNKNLLFFETLKVNLNPMKLLKNEISLQSLSIDNFKLDIDIDKNKTANFQYILDSLAKNSTKESSTTTQNESKSYLFSIEQLDLTNINFVFQDYSKEEPFIVKTKPINLTSHNIKTKENHINKFSFDIDTFNSGKITLNSNIVLKPLQLNGDIQLSNINVNKIFHYTKPSDLKLDIDSNPLNLAFNYDYKQNNSGQDIKLGKLFLNLDSISIKKDNFIVETKQLKNAIDTIELNIDKKLQYAVNNINTTMSHILFSDKQKDVTFDFKDFVNSIKEVTQEKQSSIDIVQILKTPSSGELKANIKVVQEPLSINMDLNTKNIDLQPYNKYIQDFINLDIKSAFISNQAHLNFSKENNQTNIDLKSNITLQNIDIENSAIKQPLVSLKEIKITDMSYKNDNLYIKDIQIEKPYIQFMLNDNNTTNFSYITKQQPDKSVTKEEKKSNFVYTVKNISIKNGHSLFQDYTVSPKFVSIDEKIEGDIKNISSDINTKTIITHKSIIDKYALLQINTDMSISNPLNSLNTNVKVENIDLTNLSSYSGKFIGNKIATGKLNLELEYNIKHAQLKSQNRIKIKDLELGEKVESKDAINAPIGLAIALLEDNEGYIDLDIPIDGDINSPSFHLSDVILDVITNTIVGIVSAPFKFLAMMIGLEGADISKVEFDYGSSEISVTQREILDNIFKAFEKRPNLQLYVKTTYVTLEDTQLLQEKNFKTKYSVFFDSKQKFKDLFKLAQNFYIKEFGKEAYQKTVEDEKDDKTQYNNMLAKLKDKIIITQNDLITLAQQRAVNIQTYLSTKGLKQNRIMINKDIKESLKNRKTDKVTVTFEVKAQ